jgi:hypothetical protein
MAKDSYEWVKWAFDGVGGATLLAVLGWLVRSRKSKVRAQTAENSVDSGHVDANANSVAIGPGASVGGSQIIYGSNNTVNVSSVVHSLGRTADEEKKESIAEIVGALGGTILLLVIILGGVYWLDREASPKAESEHTPTTTSAEPEHATSRSKPIVDHPGTSASARPTRPVTDIGIAFGSDIPGDSFGLIEEESCVTKGVTCLGEANLKDQLIQIPLRHGESWTRVALLITIYHVSETVEDPHIVVSTSSEKVGLNYPDHRDGLLHNKLEFTPGLLSPTSYSKRPESFSVDITFTPGVNRFPLTVDVWGDSLPRHTITMQLAASPELPVVKP